MSSALIDLLFWVVVLCVLFFGFRALQKRRKDDGDPGGDDS